MTTTTIIATLAAIIIGFVVSFFLSNKIAKSKETESIERGKSILADAEKNAENVKKEKLIELKEEISKKKLEFEAEVQNKKNQLQNADKQIKQKEESLNKKEKSIDTKLAEIEQQKKEIEAKNVEASNHLKGQQTKLEKIASMSKDEAKKMLLEQVKNDIKTDTAKLLNQAREELKLKINQESMNIVLTTIQRSASEFSVENTVSVVPLENDEMKGRIIGREGRNIRAFEAATGIDLVIDDTPEAVVISGYDPYRREVAKKALIKLMHDGRIHPSRIEDLVTKAEKELEEDMFAEGESIIAEMGIHNMHNELIRAVGRMRYRTSYGQNLLNHSLEVSHLAGVLASELHLEPKIAKRAALLHDIGKCISKDVEGPHAKIGADLAKKYKENNLIVNAIAAHHEDIEPESPYAVIVQIADSISGARPGARKESIENYIKRLEKLEEIATSFEGVNKTFAIQAGREIRVIVEPDKVDDLQTSYISNEIAKRIETEMDYPGQIVVTVIRERRSVAVAK
ncbi:MAG: ribonuclease Y [Ignavibacteria bacterium]|jgi:ribonuclease Y|nr:ribonuclease Y [Ignavibacteria bacterium]